MNAFDLFAKLTLDTSEYEKKLTSAEKEAANRWGVTTDTVAAGVTKVQKGAMMLAGAGVAAVGAFGVSAVKTGMEFESSMSQVAATMGMSASDIANNVNGAGDTFAALSEKAREMGGTTVYSASEAAEGLNILAMSGYDAEQSMSMIEDVLHLAAAGSMDMGSAAAYVSGAMKGFNDASKDSGYYADLMAQGATLANTSVAQLGEAMSSGAATAASYGQTADSMTLSLLRLAEQGEVGSAAGTALAAAMKDLYTPTDQARAALDELGVSAYDSEGKARDFNTVVNELEASMEGMTDEQKAAYKQTIFGIQGLNAYNKMVVTSKDKQDEWSAALASASDGMGAAAQQYDTMTDNLQGALDGLKSAFSELKIQVSEKLAPHLQTLVEWLTKIIQNADKIAPVIIGLGVAFGIFAVAINITSLIRGVTGAMAALNAVLAANPIGIIIALVAGLVAAIVTLWNTNEDFRNRVIEIWENIKQAFLDAKEAVVQAWQDIGQWFTDRWNEIVAAFGAVVEWFSSLFTGARDAVNNIWQDIGSWFSERWADITNAFAAVVDWFSEKFTAAKDAVHNAWSAIGSWFSERWSEISNAFASADSWFSQKFTAASNAVHTAWSGIGSWFTEKWTEIQNVFSNAWSIFHDVGANIVKGLMAGIGRWISNAMQKARELIRSVKGAANDEAGVRSPSRVFRQIGQYLDEGLMLGIDDEAEGPISAMTKLMQNIIAAGDNGMNASLTSPVTGRENNSTMRRGGERYGGVSIIVNAAQGQSEESIAARVERKLAEALSQREAVWA